MVGGWGVILWVGGVRYVEGVGAMVYGDWGVVFWLRVVYRLPKLTWSRVPGSACLDKLRPPLGVSTTAHSASIQYRLHRSPARLID